MTRATPRVVVLAGGVGGARFTRGLRAELQSAGEPDITVVANTGDDMWLAGLRVCPDLDTIMYTLGGAIHEGQGWGRADETGRVAGELTAYGVGWPWFTLGDLDLGTHIARTALLQQGLTLTEATERLTERWNPGVRLLPMTDDPVETHVRLARSVDEHPAGSLVHFEEWWVRYRAGAPASEFVQVGLDQATPPVRVLDAIASADLVVLPPSNPVVSIGTILALPGVRDALRASRRVVGVSPIIAGSAVRGMAETCLGVIGVDATAEAVGAHYGSRAAGGLLDAWLVDEADAAAVPALIERGIEARAVPLWMRDLASTQAIARGVLDAAGMPRNS